MFKKFDYNGIGRTFVVGDIHGEFELLNQKLDQLGFDDKVDTLFSVGDLVDRGPNSKAALLWLRYPWFNAVRGNHEQMVIDAGGTYWHVQNGGAWFNDLDENEQRKFIAAFKNLPYIIQFESPNGKQIGVVHAAFPHDWPINPSAYVEFCEENGSDYNPLLWDREQIRASRFGELAPAQGIDHIYMGHTPCKEPITSGNRTWLDTGAFATGNLTVVEVL